MAEPDKVSDVETKHLDFIQAVIARLANNSFLIKGWAITVAAAIYGFAAHALRWQVAILGLLTTVAFWSLDTYYLRQERLYRCLYRAACHGAVAPFSMDARPFGTQVRPRDVRFSVTLGVFYGLILAVGVILTVASVVHDPTSAQSAEQDAETADE